MPATSPSPSKFVAREEFETFSRNVDRQFSNMGNALEGLGRKIDAIGGRGTDWKAIIGVASLLVTVMALIGGVFAWGLKSSINNVAEKIEIFDQRQHTEMDKVADLRVDLAVLKARLPQGPRQP